MSWQLKPKPDLEALEERIIEQGLDRSAFPILNNIPELRADCKEIWDAFGILSSSRASGFGAPQPISLSDMLSYFIIIDLDDEDERMEYVVLLQRMDRLYISELSKRMDQKAKSRPSK